MEHHHRANIDVEHSSRTAVNVMYLQVGETSLIIALNLMRYWYIIQLTKFSGHVTNFAWKTYVIAVLYM